MPRLSRIKKTELTTKAITKALDSLLDRSASGVTYSFNVVPEQDEYPNILLSVTNTVELYIELLPHLKRKVEQYIVWDFGSGIGNILLLLHSLITSNLLYRTSVKLVGIEKEKSYIEASNCILDPFDFTDIEFNLKSISKLPPQLSLLTGQKMDSSIFIDVPKRQHIVYCNSPFSDLDKQRELMETLILMFPKETLFIFPMSGNIGSEYTKGLKTINNNLYKKTHANVCTKK